MEKRSGSTGSWMMKYFEDYWLESAFHFTDYRKPVWLYKQGRDGINFITNDFKGNNIHFQLAIIVFKNFIEKLTLMKAASSQGPVGVRERKPALSPQPSPRRTPAVRVWDYLLGEWIHHSGREHCWRKQLYISSFYSSEFAPNVLIL